MIKKYLCKKHASVTTITLFAIMCVLFPMLAIIYDIGMMHVYKQDLKNIQELSGTVCTPDASSKGLPDICENLAYQYVMANIVGDGVSPVTSKYGEAIRKYRVTERSIPNCNSQGVGKTRLCVNGTFGQDNVKVKMKPIGGGAKRMTVNIVGIRYKPLFLNKKMFMFGNAKAPSNAEDTWELKIPESNFSGTYQQH